MSVIFTSTPRSTDINERASAQGRCAAVSIAFSSLFAPALAATAIPEAELAPINVRSERKGAYQVDRSASDKFTAPLLDTPKTVTVIKHELIDERGATSLTEVLRTTPGITLGAGEGGTPIGDRPFVRGYDASTDLMIDGLRDIGRFSHEAFNIEQIEIVKGPGSAYTGRGSTGGSINMVSKAPKAENFYTGSITLGTDQTRRLTTDANWLLGDDTALRLNLMAHDADVAGRDAAKVSRWGVAPSLTLGLHSGIEVTLSYYGLRTDDIPDQGLPFDTINRTGLPVQVDRKNFYGLSSRDYRRNAADIGTLDVSHQMGDGSKLRNVTRYGKTSNEYVYSRPTLQDDPKKRNYGMVTRRGLGNKLENSSLINQTELTGKLRTAGLEHSYAAGVELSRERTYNSRFIISNDAPVADLYHPDFGQAFTGTIDRSAPAGLTKHDNRAVYMFDTIALTPQWDLNGGLRYDRYEVSSSAGKRGSWGFWNYQAGIVFKPQPNASIYASYGTSSNPSGEAEGQIGGADGVAGGGLRDVAPESNRSIEVGSKWNVLDEQLMLTAAVFRTEKVNGRAVDPTSGLVELIGNSRVDGVELGAAGNLTPAWTLFGGYTWLRPILRADGAGGNSGKQLKYVAPRSFSAWTTYKPSTQLTVGAGASYMSERFVTDDNTRRLPSYWRYDAMASYKVSKHLDFRLNIQNLSNATIFDGSHVGVFANIAPGRSVLLTANFKY
ncbi:Ferrichrome-iron receptor [Collimonas arenae]|uniref:Ferrichrome-iron receptor n=1 Tax=Collimonas arenae TaxID=279058 RepID=A0A0A1FA60_9BURK|nr:TonB-dependent siderophore receptor [Collimonas arenae]AIY39717.1 Ferrichrome-iron receptor [Collimonas arenae]